MYIHNYQIHNVLNAYRKQLSHGPEKAGAKRPDQPTPRDMVSLSQQGQQPSIVNKISAEIIDRITQFGPQSEFENALADQFSAPAREHPRQNNGRGIEFTYTLIDEQNRKTTHSLPIETWDNQYNQRVTENALPLDMTKEHQPAKELVNNQPESPKKWKG